MTIFTIAKPEEGEKTRVEHAEASKTRAERKTSLSPLFAVTLVVVSVIIAAVVAGIIVFFGLQTCRADHQSDETVSSGDMDFERRGWFDDHRFSERCHYDHDNDIVTMVLIGDGFGENATVVYDFKRGLFTYVLQSKNKCFLGSLNQDDINGFRNAHDGETIELGAIKPRDFITNFDNTIPPGFLALTTSPVVNDLCLSKNSQWIEPAVDDEDDITSRQQRKKRHGFQILFKDGTRICS